MKVLLISPLPPPSGGIATWTDLYINSNEAKRNYVKVINTAINGDRINNLAKISLWDELKRAFNIYYGTKQFLQKDTFDVVHLNTSCSLYGMIRDVICAIRVKRSGKRLILQCHCDTSVKIKGRLSQLVFKKLCNLSNIVISLNKASRNHIEELTGENSLIVPNFCKTDTLDNFYEKTTFGNIKIIIYAGHITKAKGCDSVITVARKLPDITFKLIGYISDEIKEIPCTDNVRFTGEISKHDVISEMVAADLLLFPSHTEGFPNVVLEAMLCGLPVIATPVGAIPDMIEDKGGLLVGIDDIDGMINAIQRLEDANKRKQMSKWNRDKVLNNYSVEAVMKYLFSIYKKSITLLDDFGVDNEDCANY